MISLHSPSETRPQSQMRCPFKHKYNTKPHTYMSYPSTVTYNNMPFTWMIFFHILVHIIFKQLVFWFFQTPNLKCHTMTHLVENNPDNHPSPHHQTSSPQLSTTTLLVGFPLFVPQACNKRCVVKMLYNGIGCCPTNN